MENDDFIIYEVLVDDIDKYFMRKWKVLDRGFFVFVF